MTTFEKITALINTQSSFVLEAGAGSGKTFTLIQTINYILETKGIALKFNNRVIVCITYTNVAKNQIIERIENNPLVIVLTIHEFLWASISNYQKQLLTELDLLNAKMQIEKPEKFEPDLLKRTGLKEVIYNDSGYRDFEKGLLHHDDVITLAAALFNKYGVLTNILADKYPYIFIDEYQDTAPDTISALLNSLWERNKDKVLLGFFGDSYQKIYDGGVGDLDEYVMAKKLTLVPKQENYRSSSNVIALLNKVRSNIQQVAPEDKKMVQGSAIFINCDNYPVKGAKEKILEYERSLVPTKNANYDKIINHLTQLGWNFGEHSDDKILIIANSRVAERGGFGNLYRIFSTRYSEGVNDQLMKRENILVRFFLGSLDKKTSKERKNGIEHLIFAWNKKEFSSVVHFLNSFGTKNGIGEEYFNLKCHEDKQRVASKLTFLQNLRTTGTVKDVFEFVLENKIVLLQDGLAKYLKRIETPLVEIEDQEQKERLERDIQLFNSTMALQYIEFVKLFKHTQNQTVFSTKHGTKGDQYRNVLVVIDDTSWKQKYNFEKFINGQDDSEERKIRTRNLFYVSCSRAVENLVVLSLSSMEDAAMGFVSNWFGAENVYSINRIEIK